MRTLAAGTQRFDLFVPHMLGSEGASEVLTPEGAAEFPPMLLVLTVGGFCVCLDDLHAYSVGAPVFGAASICL